MLKYSRISCSRCWTSSRIGSAITLRASRRIFRSSSSYNTVFSEAPGNLIGVQPKIEQFVPDGSSRPEDVGFEQQPGPHGIEDGLRRGVNPIDLKVFIHDQENVEILGAGFTVTKLP